MDNVLPMDKPLCLNLGFPMFNPTLRNVSGVMWGVEKGGATARSETLPNTGQAGKYIMGKVSDLASSPSTSLSPHNSHSS